MLPVDGLRCSKENQIGRYHPRKAKLKMDDTRYRQGCRHTDPRPNPCDLV